MPVEREDHQSACGLFDQLDRILQIDDLKQAHYLVWAGVDPSYDTKSLASYAAATRSRKAVESFADAWAQQWEMHANMDY